MVVVGNEGGLDVFGAATVPLIFNFSILGRIEGVLLRAIRRQRQAAAFPDMPAGNFRLLPGSTGMNAAFGGTPPCLGGGGKDLKQGGSDFEGDRPQ